MGMGVYATPIHLPSVINLPTIDALQWSVRQALNYINNEVALLPTEVQLMVNMWKQATNYMATEAPGQDAIRRRGRPQHVQWLLLEGANNPGSNTEGSQTQHGGHRGEA